MSNSIKYGSKVIGQVDDRPYYLIKQRIKQQKKIVKNSRNAIKNRYNWAEVV